MAVGIVEIMVNRKLQFAVGCLVFICAGCAVAKVSQLAFTATAQRGYYQNAAVLARGEIGKHNTSRDLLWNLQLGTVERLLKNYEASNAAFDHAEDAYRTYDLQSLFAKSWDTSKAFVFNDSALPYTGRHFERIMMNTYKALNFAALGDRQNARIEFNRALVRQDEAKAFYVAEIQRLEEERARRRQSGKQQDRIVEETMANPELQQIINRQYKNLDGFKAYTDFINPYTNLCAGLFFWLIGDSPKAADILKQAHAMEPDNQVVADAFKRLTSGDQPSRELWVLFENGLVPQRREIRIDIPLILAQNNIKYVGTAFVNLTEGQSAFENIAVTAANGRSAVTESFTGMESVITQEFRRELPLMTFREVSRVAFKTTFQYQMDRNYGFLAGLAGALYQAATTAIDVRSWSTLPHEFQVGHLKIGNSRTITVSAEGHEPQTINLEPDAGNMILYVRAMSKEAAPTVDIITFD